MLINKENTQGNQQTQDEQQEKEEEDTYEQAPSSVSAWHEAVLLP